MTLTLELNAPDPTSGLTVSQAFGPEGGTIGRDPGCALVLSHPKVSGHHALVIYQDGRFFIEDTSRNGICLNTRSNRLERGRQYPLASGDLLLIDPYEINVSVSGGEADFDPVRPPRRVERHPVEQRRHVADPFAGDDPFGGEDPFAPPAEVRPVSLEDAGQDPLPHELDPLELLNLGQKTPPPRNVPSAADLEAGSPLEAHFQPPDVMASPSPVPRNDVLIPQDYDPLAPDDSQSFGRPSSPPPRPERAPARPRPVAPPPPPPVVAPEPVAPDPPAVRVAEPAPPARVASPGDASGGGDLGMVLAGAGLDAALATPELARQLGAILRVVVSGVMDVMESRSAIKDEVGLRRTRFRPIENNPLKFSANVDDALHNLLVKRNPAYLEPVAAFEQAFADLRNHQIAMLGGIQAAFQSVLGEFDPEKLQQDFDRQAGKGLVPAKLRYWDLYKERVEALLKDMDTSYRELFAEAFARAYTERLERLKSQDGGSDGRSAAGPTATPDR